MSDTPSQQVTRLLQQIGRGDRRAAEELLPLVYAELRRLAQAKMARESPGQTLQPTALVHEAYLRLIGPDDPGWENRGHFFGAAAEAMRRILVERARRVGRLKRGANPKRVELDGEAAAAVEPDADELLAIDQALTRLEQLDRQMSDVVKLRYFVGLSVEETAKALGISPRGVNRHWTGARAWLHRQMRGAGDTDTD